MVSRDDAEWPCERCSTTSRGRRARRDGPYPERVIEAWDEIFAGYKGDASSILTATFNGEGYDGIVLLSNIEFHSTCEHHLQPFSGHAHVAYIPVDRIVGISKLARLVDLHARRLQNQERITKSIADDLEHHLQPLGQPSFSKPTMVACVAVA